MGGYVKSSQGSPLVPAGESRVIGYLAAGGRVSPRTRGGIHCLLIRGVSVEGLPSYPRGNLTPPPRSPGCSRSPLVPAGNPSIGKEP